jgi:hypothetical protein
MKTINIFIATMLLFVVSGCETKENVHNTAEIERSMNQLNVNINTLKEAVLNYGDTSAYERLSVAYLDYSVQEEFLFYAMIMANRFDYPQAYFDVYFCLTQAFSRDISKIDDRSAQLAIEFLLKAYEKEHHQAKDIVESYSIKNNNESRVQIEHIFREHE